MPDLASNSCHSRGGPLFQIAPYVETLRTLQANSLVRGSFASESRAQHDLVENSRHVLLEPLICTTIPNVPPTSGTDFHCSLIVIRVATAGLKR